MSRVTNLKFWGRPMSGSGDPTWWLRIDALDLTVKIFAATPTNRCSWLISEHGCALISDTATGPVAARNAAEKWLENRAALTQKLAAKRAA